MMMNPFSYLALRYKNCFYAREALCVVLLSYFIPIIALTMFATYQSTKDHRKAIDGDHRALLTADGK